MSKPSPAVPDKTAALSQPPVIRLDKAHLSLGADAGAVHILKGISLDIAAGETVGVLGQAVLARQAF